MNKALTYIPWILAIVSITALITFLLTSKQPQEVVETPPVVEDVNTQQEEVVEEILESQEEEVVLEPDEPREVSSEPRETPQTTTTTQPTPQVTIPAPEQAPVAETTPTLEPVVEDTVDTAYQEKLLRFYNKVEQLQENYEDDLDEYSNSTIVKYENKLESLEEDYDEWASGGPYQGSQAQEYNEFMTSYSSLKVEYQSILEEDYAEGYAYLEQQFVREVTELQEDWNINPEDRIF